MQEDDTMSTLRSSFLEYMNRLCPELSPAAQAQLTISMGFVQQTRQVFEHQIHQRQYEHVGILIKRALRNTDELIRQDRTYADQLRLVETIGRLHLPSHLQDFIRDHDNLYHAAVQSRHLVQDLGRNSANINCLAHVEARILYVRIVFSFNIIRTTRSPAERARLRKDLPILKTMHDCTDMLVDEIWHAISRLAAIWILLSGDTELENVGPDHDVNAFGSDIHVIPARRGPFAAIFDDNEKLDHTERCCICLEHYPNSHPAFKLTLCGHVIGKSCLAAWLNSTTQNANQCPFCRTTLCPRRPRQLATRIQALQTESDELSDRLHHALRVLEDIDELANEIYGSGAQGELGVWAGDAVLEVNKRCLVNGLGFGFMREKTYKVGWRLARVDWARVAEEYAAEQGRGVSSS